MSRLKLLLIVVLLPALLLAGCTQSKNVTQKDKPAKQTAKKYKFPKTTGDWINSDPYKVGESVPDIKTAERKAGFKVRELKALDLKPEIRYTGGVNLIYPNGVVFIQFPITDDEVEKGYQAAVYSGQAPTADKSLEAKRGVFYRSQVENDKRFRQRNNDGPDTPIEYTKLNGHPAMVSERGNNIIDGKKVPRGAAVVWYQNGIQYTIKGPPEMPLAELLKLAKSSI